MLPISSLRAKPSVPFPPIVCAMGYAGMQVRSFAAGAGPADADLVLWNWSADWPSRGSSSNSTLNTEIVFFAIRTPALSVVSMVHNKKQFLTGSFYPAALGVPCCRLLGHAAVAADLDNMATSNGRITRRLRADHRVLWRRCDPHPRASSYRCLSRSSVDATS